MSFVGSLPLEVIHEIFTLCVDTSDFTTDWSAMTSPTKPRPSYPASLTSVCKRWADAALSLPELWSTISIRIGEGRGGSQHLDSSRCCPPIPVISTWIARSGTTPLSISLMPSMWHESGIYDTGCRHIMREVFEGILLPQAHRWQRIALWRTSTADFSPVDALKLKQNYIALEHVSIWGDVESDSITHLLVHASRLRRLELEPHGPRRPQATPLPLSRRLERIVPWKQLKKIRLGLLADKVYDAPGALVLLQRCPQLAIPMHPGVVTSAEMPNILHGRLEELNFEGSTRGQITLFLNHTTLPSLRSIALSPGTSGEDRQSRENRALATSFANFVARSGCELQEFIYHGPVAMLLIKYPPLWCHRILPFLPTVSASITRLSIEVGQAEADELIEGLSLRPSWQSVHGGSNPINCPRLRHLNLILWPMAAAPKAVTYYLYPGRLLRLIRSRFNIPMECSSDFEELQSINIQIMVKRAGSLHLGSRPPKPGSLAAHRLVDGMREVDEQLEDLASTARPTAREIRWAAMCPPNQLYSRTFRMNR